MTLNCCWFSGEGDEFTFVAFHGNASNMAARADVYRFLRALPANVLAVEYRGYGHSEGSPSEKGIYVDAQAAYDYLTRQRGIRPSRLISYGQSTGTAVAGDVAAKRDVAGLGVGPPVPSGRRGARRGYPCV